MLHEDVLRDDAAVEPPARLPALLSLLAGGAVEMTDPRDREGLHPLVIPLARDEHGRTIGLLRWPTAPRSMPVPVVRTEGHGMRLVARSADEWLHRELATRDARKEPMGGLLDAANRPGRLYEVGDVARTGLPLNAYLLLKAGVGHEFFEELVEAHLAKGDARAAVITAERACRDASGAADGWARPHAFRAKLHEKLGEHEQAADAARLALLEPTWTLGMPFEPIARLAGWKDPIDASPYHRLADAADKPPADRAAHRMDAVAVEGTPWDDVRPELARLYEEAGLPQIARLVRGR